jgi:uncharacterized Tic20 family protein
MAEDNENQQSQEQQAGGEQADQSAAEVQQVSAEQSEINKDARMWAMFCHLAGLAGFVVPVIISGIIAPLIVWQIKKEEHPFVDDNGKEAVNFQISIGIYALISALLIPVLCIGVVLLTAVGIVDLVFLLIASVKANNGESYRYPLTIRFIK